MLRSPMPKTTYLIRNALGYSAEGVLLFLIKSVAENKFYIHNMNLKNKNETVALNAKDKISRGYNNDELSRTDNIANNASNVNNNDTKFPLDVNFSYNELIKKPDIKKAML